MIKEVTKTKKIERKVLDSIKCDICGTECKSNHTEWDFDSNGWNAKREEIDLPQTTFHANTWTWDNKENREHGTITVAMRRMNTISEEPFVLELDICPSCFRKHIWSLRNKK
jgi:hypothetical protein